MAARDELDSKKEEIKKVISNIEDEKKDCGEELKQYKEQELILIKRINDLNLKLNKLYKIINDITNQFNSNITQTDKPVIDELNKKLSSLGDLYSNPSQNKKTISSPNKQNVIPEIKITTASQP